MTSGFLRSGTPLLFAMAAVSVFAFAHPVHAAVRTWTGGGATNNWSESANWSSSAVPGTGDIATFDATSTKNATVNVSISVAGIDINSGYTGTITQASAMTIGTSDFDISAGTFTGNNLAITDNGNFKVSGGTFNSTSGVLSVAKAFTITSGTFNAGTGTVTATALSNTWDVLTSQTFNNFIINKSGAGSFVSIPSGDTLVVAGALTLTNGSVNTGTIDARGNISQASTFGGGSAVIDFGDNAVAQTYTMNGGTSPTVRLDNASDASDSIAVAAASTTIGGLVTTSGFGANVIPLSNPSDYALTFGTWNEAAGSYDASAQTNWTFGAGSFIIGTGATLVAPVTLNNTGLNSTWNVDSSQTFNNLTINKTSSQSINLATGDTIVITGTLTLTGGSLTTSIGGTAIFDVRGNVSQTSGFQGGPAIISFGDDGVAQTYTVNGGVTPVIRLDSAADANDSISLAAASTIGTLSVTAGFSGAIPLANPSNYTVTVGTWSQAAGSYDASAQSAWNISANVTIGSGVSFIAPTTVTATSSNATWDVDSSQNFNNLVVNKPSQTLSIPTGDVLVVNGTLTLTAGAVSTGIGGTGSISAMGDINQAATFSGGSAMIDFGNDAVAQTYTINGGVAPGIRLDAAADASDSINVTATATVTNLTTTGGFSGAIPLVNGSNVVLTFTTWSQAAGTYDASAQSSWKFSTFGISGGSFVAPALVTAIGSNAYWAMTGGQEFSNFTLNKPSQTLIITSGNLIVNGTMTMTAGGTSTGILEVRGNVVIAAATGSVGRMDFTGSATQSLDLSATGASGAMNGDIHVNKSGGEVDLASNLVMDASGQDLIIEEGLLNLKGFNLTVNGSGATFVIQNGGILSLYGSETVTHLTNQPTQQSGSAVIYTGDGDSAADSYTITNLSTSYDSLVILSTDGAVDSYVLGANVDINNIFGIVYGAFDVSASNYSMNVAGDWYNLDAANMRNGSVVLDGADQALHGSTNFYNLTKSVSSAATLTLEAGETQVIAGSLSLSGASGNLLSVRSSSGGTQAIIDPQGAMTLDYLDVQDNNNVDANPAVTTNSVDSGNNTNWTF